LVFIDVSSCENRGNKVILSSSHFMEIDIDVVVVDYHLFTTFGVKIPYF